MMSLENLFRFRFNVVLLVAAFFHLELLFAAPLCLALFQSDTAPGKVQFTQDASNRSATVLIQDPSDSKFYAQGTVSSVRGRNFLQLVLVLRSQDGKRSSLRGQEAVHAILKTFEEKGIKIDAFQAHWNDHLRDFHGASDNFVQFLSAYKAALLREQRSLDLPADINKEWIVPEKLRPFLRASLEAASETWSGKVMKRYGFEHIEAIIIRYEKGRSKFDQQEGSLDIQIVWSQAPSVDPVKFYHDRSIMGSFVGSVLPRLHQMLEQVP